MALKQKLTGNYKHFDFIQMTNFCESKGYEVELIRSRKGITCDLYHKGNLLKVGVNVFKTCVDAQKETYTKLYLAINK
jgi:hypothetical protein